MNFVLIKKKRRKLFSAENQHFLRGEEGKKNPSSASFLQYHLPVPYYECLLLLYFLSASLTEEVHF